MRIDDNLSQEEMKQKSKQFANYYCYTSSELCDVYINKALTVTNGGILVVRDENKSDSQSRFLDRMQKNGKIKPANA